MSKTPNILIIDDEVEVGNFLNHLLSSKGYDVSVGYSGTDCNQLLEREHYHLAMLDVKLPDTSGLSLLAKVKAKFPLCKTIIMTGYSTVKTAVEAIKLGANDYIEKPFDDIDQLETLIDELLDGTVTSEQSTMDKLAKDSGFMIGESQTMKQLVTMAYKISKKNVNVLIEGETGTGKEVLAHYIHLASKRMEHPLIGINCGAISEALLESELFGHEKGSFTGAFKERKGVFEIASSGTLFLDEIGEASLSTQVKLLRVLETGEFMRVGDESIRKTNTRIIAASHVNLVNAVQEKRFREDLLYRLDVVKLTIPPLRERKEDLPSLITYLLEKHHSSLHFSNEAMNVLMEYDWPGNIRELSNVIKRAVVLADGEVNIIGTDYLPEKLLSSQTHSPPEQLLDREESFEVYLKRWNQKILSLWKTEGEVDLSSVLIQVKELETEVGKAFVQRTLKSTIGDRKVAAERLNISMRKLRYLLNEKGSS
ncbi:sigma-54-dependent transcriptional regulator [Halalkalibacter alkalisediminis]|uniref:Sigma-54-dependent transcriptional regulator n=1 Tax=Halalkalibacter alkalisediminis TaxID=935616 RepID=A0ABV6NNQ4_9BACI|nr:sigma-54 dependent transcriptional regulator [Halalkalibacter alkalisediminis]